MVQAAAGENIAFSEVKEGKIELRAACDGVLKIDLECLRMRKNVVRRKQIMRFVINLANELRLQVIAEGAETEEQIALLREMGCEYAQGYYYGRPMPQEDFQEYLLRRPNSEMKVL